MFQTVLLTLFGRLLASWDSNRTWRSSSRCNQEPYWSNIRMEDPKTTWWCTASVYAEVVYCWGFLGVSIAHWAASWNMSFCLSCLILASLERDCCTLLYFVMDIKHVFSLLCSVSQLFWFSCQYLPNGWLERLPMMPVASWGDIAIMTRLKIVYFMVGMLCYYVLLPAPNVVFDTSMAWYRSFVLKVPLDINQPARFDTVGWMMVIRPVTGSVSAVSKDSPL